MSHSRLACLLLGLMVLPLGGLPTPRLSPEQMQQQASVVAEGRLVRVRLLKRWVDADGYERGLFECRLKVEKLLKGSPALVDGELVYGVDAYAEGRWNALPPMGLIYEGTTQAVSPGSRLRLHLKPSSLAGGLERVHFNSGLEVLEPAKGSFPREVGPWMKP